MIILILHGIGGYPGVHWQQWLADTGEKLGYTIVAPRLPQADHPDRTEWLHCIEEALEGLPLNQVIIVGHSLGVVSALDFIETASGKVHGLIAVSGFAEDYGSELNNCFMHGRHINFSAILDHLKNVSVLYGDDDPYVPQYVLKSLAVSLHVKPIIIPNGGHLNSETGYTSFPLLIDIIKRMEG